MLMRIFHSLYFQQECLQSRGAKLSLILPTEEMEIFHKLAVLESFHLERRCQVFKKPNVKGRVLATYILNKETNIIEEEELLIRESDGSYSCEYKKLTKEFYLNY